MNILVVGAVGFIGRHVVRRLFESGHDVTLRPGSCQAAAPVPGAALHPWRLRPRLRRAAGLIRETGDRSYRTVHTEGPIALFEACLAAGVRRVLQVSALGADAGAVTRYYLSKRAADDHLAALDPAGERLAPRRAPGVCVRVGAPVPGIYRGLGFSAGSPRRPLPASAGGLEALPWLAPRA